MRCVVALLLSLGAAACASTQDSPRYAIVTDQSVVARDESDLQRVVGMRDKLGTDFVWFVSDGREYVVTDRPLVAEAARIAGSVLGFRWMDDSTNPNHHSVSTLGDHRQATDFQSPTLAATAGVADQVKHVDIRMNDLLETAMKRGLALPAQSRSPEAVSRKLTPARSL